MTLAHARHARPFSCKPSHSGGVHAIYASHSRTRVAIQPRAATGQKHDGHAASNHPRNALAASIQAAVLSGAIIAASLFPAPVLADAVPGNLSDLSGMLASMSDVQKSKLDAAEDSFQQSDTLKKLLERSAANKEENKKEIQNKYCYRQAELGIGDCGGLRYIPGMTKSGKQKTPKWLSDALGVEVPEVEGEGKTLSDLLGPSAE